MHDVFRVIEQGVNWIFKLAEMVWKWSFGEVWHMFATHGAKFQNLPHTKQIVMVLVAAAIIFILVRIFRELWGAIMRILEGIINLLRAILNNLVPLLIAGVIAYAGSWFINNIAVVW